ncbi:cyclic nucleotide-binding domain-containing protein [Streptomyces sp. NPDC006997]|uniref:Crp/Fnr family transcriptional regulator n=1 Tax=Streptomyces sp. NPDC006997 TaxID=3155356 RepID=UPI003405E9DC
MTTTTFTPRLTRTLPTEYRGRLMTAAREVDIPSGTRLFDEGSRADNFWIIRSGTIALDIRVPGRRPVVVESVGYGELVGWSWLFPPYLWQLGAQAVGPVRAYEFDAGAARRMCAADPAMGEAVALWIGRVLAHRLYATRTRLLDLYAPYGSGVPG